MEAGGGGGGGGGGMSSLLSLEDLHHPHPPNGHLHESQTNQQEHQDDFLEQIMLSTINPNCGWPSHNGNGGHDLSPSNPNPNTKSCDSPPNEDPEASFHYGPHDQMNGGKSFLLHHHLQLLSRDSSLLLPSLPLSLATADSHSDVFKSPTPQAQAAADNYNGFAAGSLHGNQQHFHHPPQGQGGPALAGKNYGSQGAVMNQPPAPQPSASTGGSSGAAPPQRQRVRARRGQATDPHSIAERLRRERIAERMKALQELVPNSNKTDKASMLDEIIDYVKFLQLQVKVLSMSRLGGAGAIAPLVADMSSEGGGGGVGRSSNGNQTASTNESMTVTEHQVAKLMEEDMGSAMQYLQGKGLCLMPISLATAISTATCHSRNPPRPHRNGASNNPQLVAAVQSNGTEVGPSSPNMSVLTVQSATLDNASADHPSVKDATNPSSSK